jgi:hypothetical protein
MFFKVYSRLRYIAKGTNSRGMSSPQLIERSSARAGELTRRNKLFLRGYSKARDEDSRRLFILRQFSELMLKVSYPEKVLCWSDLFVYLGYIFYGFYL